MKLLALLVAFVALTSAAFVFTAQHSAININSPTEQIIPFKYPLYKQCDPRYVANNVLIHDLKLIIYKKNKFGCRWGNNMMENITVCSVGCLMSSVSMALGGHEILIAG